MTKLSAKFVNAENARLTIVAKAGKRGFNVAADLVPLLRDDRHLRRGLQEDGGEIVDLGRRGLTAREHPEVDPDFD